MKCFCPVNGLYCKNPEYARLLPSREKVQSHERKAPSSPQLRVFTGSQHEKTPPPPHLRILAASQYERKAPLREFAISQARSITLGVLTQKPAC